MPALLDALARRLFVALGPRLHIRAATPELVCFFHHRPPAGFVGLGGEVLFADATTLGVDGLVRHLRIEEVAGTTVAFSVDAGAGELSCLDGQALLAPSRSARGEAFISRAVARYLADMALPIAQHRNQKLAEGVCLSADEAIVQARHLSTLRPRQLPIGGPNP